MPYHTLKKILIIISIILNIIAIFSFANGFIGLRYYSYGWIGILSLGLNCLINSWYPLGLRFWMYISTLMSILAFIPFLGYFALLAGIKFAVDDILFLVDIFDDKMRPEKPVEADQNPFTTFQKDVIDVEVVE
jgi:hypothetical protein